MNLRLSFHFLPNLSTFLHGDTFRNTLSPTSYSMPFLFKSAYDFYRSLAAFNLCRIPKLSLLYLLLCLDQSLNAHSICPTHKSSTVTPRFPVRPDWRIRTEFGVRDHILGLFFSFFFLKLKLYLWVWPTSYNRI